MWQRILNEGKVQQPAIDNILATGKDYLADCSALERSFSLMKRAKTDWCNRLEPHTVSQLMMIKSNGPDLDSFDAQPHIPVSSFGTKKRQGVLTVCMAAGGIKGLIYLEARTCFSVHSGIQKNLLQKTMEVVATLGSSLC